MSRNRWLRRANTHGWKHLCSINNVCCRVEEKVFHDGSDGKAGPMQQKILAFNATYVQ